MEHFKSSSHYLDRERNGYNLQPIQPPGHTYSSENNHVPYEQCIHINIEPVRYLHQPTSHIESSNYWQNENTYPSNTSISNYQPPINRYTNRQYTDMSNYSNRGQCMSYQNQYFQPQRFTMPLNDNFQNNLQNSSVYENLYPSIVGHTHTREMASGIPSSEYGIQENFREERLCTRPRSTHNTHIPDLAIRYDTSYLSDYDDQSSQIDSQYDDDGVESNVSDTSSDSYNYPACPRYEDIMHTDDEPDAPTSTSCSENLIINIPITISTTYAVMDSLNISIPRQKIIDRYILYNRSMADYLHNHAIVVLNAYQEEIKKKNMILNHTQGINDIILQQIYIYIN